MKTIAILALLTLACCAGEPVHAPGAPSDGPPCHRPAGQVSAC